MRVPPLRRVRRLGDDLPARPVMVRRIGAARLTALMLLACMFVVAPAPQAAALGPPLLQLDVRLDPATRRLDVVADLQAQAAPPSATPGPGGSASPVREFEILLHPSLRIESASSGGTPLVVTPTARRGGLQGWHVSLAATASLRLAYGGVLPPLATGLDHRDVLQALPPMSAPEGSFLPAGSGWYPQPAGRFAYHVRVSVPAGQRAVVPGRLEQESLPAGGTGHYRANFDFPHPAEGIDLMAGPWQVRERMMPRAADAPVRLRTYFPATLDAVPGLADAYLADSARYLERYARLIGPYPYAEFSVVASPLPTGFGMPTLTYLGADILPLPFIRATSLGHEILHNWWGNGVFVDYPRGNWSEGLTTFMADYAYKEDESPAAAREMRLGWLRDFAALPRDAQPTLRDFRARTHGTEAAIGYGKAAMLFVMLRDTIGADAFARGVALFWQQQRFRTASWDALQAAFEQASGRPLRAFFAQWLERGGAPRVRIVGATSSTANENRLKLAIEQAAPAYALRVPLEIVHASRSELRWVDIAGPRTNVELALDSPATGVRLDPDMRIWRTLDASQLPPILRQWIVAPAPRLIIVSDDSALRAAAVDAANSLFERPATLIAASQARTGSTPVLVVGRPAEVDAALARMGAPARPSEVAVRGSAQVWTTASPGAAPLAVISADNADSLRALARPLPHYGAQSWLVFDGRRAIARGVWPAPGTVLPVQSGGTAAR